MPENEQEPEEQRALRKQLVSALKRAQIEQQKKDMVQQLLEPKAYERLMNIKISNYELYAQLLDVLITLARSNRIAGRMTEQQFVDLLNRLTYRREPKIEFRHK
jgi:DNA-binding TFAR19-related protein (PDSD5 family)